MDNRDHADALCAAFMGKTCLDVGISDDDRLVFNFGDTLFVLGYGAQFEVWKPEDENAPPFMPTSEAPEQTM